MNSRFVCSKVANSAATFEFRQRWYRDRDGDGYGGYYASAANTFTETAGAIVAPNVNDPINALLTQIHIDSVPGTGADAGRYSTTNTLYFYEFMLDCADQGANSNTVNPGVTNDLCDRVDNDCDGLTDEGTTTVNNAERDANSCEILNLYCGDHEVCLRQGADPNNDANYAYIARCNIFDQRPSSFGGVGLLTDDETCQNRCTGNLDFCEATTGLCVSAPTGAPSLCPIGVPNDATPACGVDADDDGDECDYFETLYTCPEDCAPSATSITDLETACPTAVGGTCLDPNADGSACTNTDGDRLCDAYEIYLENLWATRGNRERELGPLNYVPGFSSNSPDSDDDGVNDDVDFCPGTRVEVGDSIRSGAIDFTGCYTTDFVRNPIRDGVPAPGSGTIPDWIELGGHRPDGCYTTLEIAATNNQFMGGDSGSGNEMKTSVECRSSYLWR